MKSDLWDRYKKYLNVNESVGITLDISRMKFHDSFFEEMDFSLQTAFDAMEDLEKGAIANIDENRMVGHYWLRHPSLAPTQDIRNAIVDSIEKIKQFAEDIRSGAIKTPQGKTFKNLLLIGIGGSALGPQFVYEALGTSQGMDFYLFDNTDPDGMDMIFSKIGEDLSETLVLVVSKSGGTKETRNGMLEVKNAYEKRGLSFSKCAVAITEAGSLLDQVAQGWLQKFPMWDWVGGRTSVFSAVGLLPAALQGVDIDAFLQGAYEMDDITRNRVGGIPSGGVPHVHQNPSALLALMWFYAGEGKGKKDMVILPYKDRLIFLSRYLQQLVMESLGKEKNIKGEIVHQGIVVYGNKGSTDQHAFVQQLREGLPDFFATFIQVLKEKEGSILEVEPGITSGDYLQGFLLGTQEALYDNNRESITITLDEINPKTIGALIALYERAVGFYASLIGINAYHQPGVEAGKKAAEQILELQSKINRLLQENKEHLFTLEEIAQAVGQPQDLQIIFKILEYLANNHRINKKAGETYFNGQYGITEEA